MQKEKQTGLFAAPFPSQGPFAHLAGLERPGWGRTSPRPPNPTKSRHLLGLPGEIHPLNFLLLRTATAPRGQKQNLPSWAVLTQIPRAAWSKRCPENLPGAGAASGRRAGGAGLSSLSALSSTPLQLPEGKFLRERRPREMPWQEQPGKGSGVYFSSSKTCRSRISPAELFPAAEP